MVSKRSVLPLVLAVACQSLAGCSVTESMSMPSFFGSSKPAETDEVADQFRAKPFCPQVTVRPEAESMTIYDQGKSGDAGSVRYQTSIQRVARDCDIIGDEVAVRVGVAGRVAAGPKGGAGAVQVPVRVVVTDGAGKPLYSKAHIVPVTVEAPDYSALWSQIDDQVHFNKAISGDVSIIVGIDEMALKGGAAKDLKPKKKS
jgi:hypothetical protein